MAETETVGLNLSGDFAGAAEKDAAAADKLASALGKLEGKAPAPKVDTSGVDKLAASLRKLDADHKAGASGVVQRLQEARINAKIDAPKAANVDALVGSEGYGKLHSAVSRIFGEAAGGKLDAGAAKLAGAADKLGIPPEMISKAGGMLATGATALAAAAAALVIGAGALIAKGIKFGIEATDQAKIDDAILKKLGGRAGLDTEIALELGIDADAALAKAKPLLQAKFRSEEIPAQLRIAAGIDAVNGDGAGKAYLDTLTKMRASGEVGAKQIKALNAAGLASKDIYAAVASEMGISLKDAQTKIKAGQVDVDTMLKATTKAADKAFGAIGGMKAGSIAGLTQNIKTAFGELFEGFDKARANTQGALKSIFASVSGPAGQAFGKAFAKLGAAVTDLLFGPLKGKGGTSMIDGLLKGVTSGIKWITSAVKEAKPILSAIGGGLGAAFSGVWGVIKGLVPVVKLLWMGLKPIAGIMFAGTVGSLYVLGGALKAVGYAVEIVAGMFVHPTKTLKKFSRDINDAIGGPVRAAVAWLKGVPASIAGAFSGLGGKLAGFGSAIVTGLVNGIKGGIGKAIAAALGLGNAVLGAIKGVFGIASPAKALVYVGAMNAAGLAKGQNDNADIPARAGAKMAAGVSAATAGALARGGLSGGGAKGGKGAAAGGGGPTINITNNFAAGTTPAQGAAVAKANADELRAQLRAILRERQEGRAA